MDQRSGQLQHARGGDGTPTRSVSDNANTTSNDSFVDQTQQTFPTGVYEVTSNLMIAGHKVVVTARSTSHIGVIRPHFIPVSQPTVNNRPVHSIGLHIQTSGIDGDPPGVTAGSQAKKLPPLACGCEVIKWTEAYFACKSCGSSQHEVCADVNTYKYQDRSLELCNTCFRRERLGTYHVGRNYNSSTKITVSCNCMPKIWGLQDTCFDCFSCSSKQHQNCAHVNNWEDWRNIKLCNHCLTQHEAYSNLSGRATSSILKDPSVSCKCINAGALLMDDVFACLQCGLLQHVSCADININPSWGLQFCDRCSNHGDGQRYLTGSNLAGLPVQSTIVEKLLRQLCRDILWVHFCKMSSANVDSRTHKQELNTQQSLAVWPPDQEWLDVAQRCLRQLYETVGSKRWIDYMKPAVTAAREDRQRLFVRDLNNLSEWAVNYGTYRDQRWRLGLLLEVLGWEPKGSIDLAEYSLRIQDRASTSIL